MIPENIQKMKPKGYDSCTISESHGIFYVYKRTHEWDEKRQKMVSKRRSIGRIDPTVGFIPNSYGMELAASGASVAGAAKSSASKTESPSSAEKPKTAARKPKKKENPAARLEFADGYELFLQTSPEIEPALREIFGDDANMLLAITLMRLVQSANAYELEKVYPESYARALWPGLDLSRKSVEHFLTKIGKREEDIKKFLLTLRSPGKKILMDGTNFFMEGEIERTAKKDPAVRAAYVLDKETQTPEYYVYTEDHPRAKDLIRAAAEAGVDEALAVLDEKNWTINGPSLFETKGFDYVMKVPLEDHHAAAEWLRAHSDADLEQAWDDPEFGPGFGEIIPNPDAFGSLYVYMFGDAYEQMLDSSPEELAEMPDTELAAEVYATNLKDTVSDLPHEMSWLPDHTFFYFLALQRALKVPWETWKGSGVQYRASMASQKPGLAFSNFLGFRYWQVCDEASAKAGIKMQMCDLLVTARSDESIDLSHMQVHSTIRARNAAFKRLGIVRAKDKPFEEKPGKEE